MHNSFACASGLDGAVASWEIVAVHAGSCNRHAGARSGGLRCGALHDTIRRIGDLCTANNQSMRTVRVNS